MDISSSYTLNAPREQVWDALLDPDILKRAIPGCESLEPTGDNQYAMRLSVDVAGVKGVYQGAMRILDAQKPESYRVVVDGAGARGILHSDGMLRLQANDAGTTEIHYSGQAQLGGPLASLGAQVASGAASMLLKRYFGRIASLMPAVPVAAPVDSPVVASAVPEAPAPSVEAAPAEPPPTSAPADIPPAVADAAPPETFIIPTPASAVQGLYAPPPPAAPVSEPVSEAPPPAASAAPVAPAMPPPTPARTSTPARTPLSASSHESQRGSAGYIGVIIAILAVVVVVIVVLVVVGAFR